MTKTLMSLCVLATVIAVSTAIVCDYRTGDLPTVTSAALQQNCTASSAYCYSYSNYGSNLVYAGCSSPSSCNTPSCVTCTSANWCNTVVPSAISCYTRSASSTDNGTVTPCSTGISSCFTQFSSNGYAGCGSCTTAASTYYSCRECSTSLCNTNTPSSISCFTRSASTTTTSNGTLTACPTGATTCYSRNDGESGCGACTTTSTSLYACTSCSTNGCNTLPIKCYSRSSSTSSTSNGAVTTCSIGASTCYTKHSGGEGGCGSCSSSYLATYGCTLCSTDNCNTMTPSSISCYTRSASTTTTSSGTLTACPTGATSCYSFSNLEAGCGNCTTSSTSSYGCTSCSTNYCNALPQTTGSPISCYTRAANGYALIMTSCSTGVTSCYSFNSGEAGCGACTTTSGCKSCSTNYCNSATVLRLSVKMTVTCAAAGAMLVTLMRLL